MSNSKRACCVVFTAMMLALASQAGAVGQAKAPTGSAVDGAQDARKGHVVGNAGNGRQEAAAAAGDPACTAGSDANRSASCPKGINQAGLPAASAAEVNPPAAPATAERVRHGGMIKGNVEIAKGSAKQVSTPEAVEPACTTKTKDGRPTSCPKGITESGIK